MKHIIKYILVLLLPASVQAQKALPVLSLDRILASIEKNNIRLQSYLLNAESFRHSAEAATAWMAPIVGAGTFMTPYPWEKTMSPAERGNIMIQIEQDIPNPAKLRARKKYIESKARITEGSREITLNELRSQAKRLYYEWMIAKNRTNVLRENDRVMATLKKIEEVRFPFNQSQLSGVYLVDAKLEENRNKLRRQEGIISRSRAWLMTLMNVDDQDAFEIDSIGEAHFVPADIYDTSAIAIVRKDISQIDDNIRSMQLNIESLQTERKPDFRLRFDHMNPRTGAMPKAYSIMGMISIPIAPWSSKGYRSEVKAMEYSIRGMQKEREGVLQETKGRLLGMQAEIETMHERVIAMEEKIIPALEKAMDANFLLYQENKLPLTAVLESWEALNMMHMTLLDDKLEHYEMIVDYEKELFQ